MMRAIRLQVLILVLLLAFTLPALTVDAKARAKAKEKPNPNEVTIEVENKGIPGVRATMSARIHAPVEATWQALINFNQQENKYPRLKQSFCIQTEDTEEAKQDGLRNGATVSRRYKKNGCDPFAIQQKGKKWTMHLFQEFDYPFPLADRWIIALFRMDETNAGKGVYEMSGRLLFGRQKIYEIDFEIHPDPKNRQETLLKFVAWIDPGGIIMDWMISEATEYVAPKYMEILEKEAKARLGN